MKQDRMVPILSSPCPGKNTDRQVLLGPASVRDRFCSAFAFTIRVPIHPFDLLIAGQSVRTIVVKMAQRREDPAGQLGRPKALI
jgi:hypothetical protein